MLMLRGEKIYNLDLVRTDRFDGNFLVSPNGYPDISLDSHFSEIDFHLNEMKIFECELFKDKWQFRVPAEITNKWQFLDQDLD